MIIKNTPIQSMLKAFSVEGQIVIVTGGNRGIGFGIASAFAESGATVAVLCRNEESGKAAAQELKDKFGGEHCFFRCDTSIQSEVEAAVNQVKEKYGRINTLVNNAGISGGTRVFDDENLEEYRRILDVDLIGTTNVSKYVGALMREAANGGTIINISSISAYSVAATKTQACPGYFVAKAAVNQFTRYLAMELSDYGVRVNGIAPGPTHSAIDALYTPQMMSFIENQNPLHRFGEPLEIGALCVFLASPAACHITGTTITHDGGMVLVG